MYCKSLYLLHIALHVLPVFTFSLHCSIRLCSLPLLPCNALPVLKCILHCLPVFRLSLHVSQIVLPLVKVSYIYLTLPCLSLNLPYIYLTSPCLSLNVSYI